MSAQRHTTRMANRRFLIVDDDASITGMLCMFLRSLGHSAHSLTDSTKTLSWLDLNPCDTVILDLAMPGIDGLSLVKMIREKQPDMPIVIFTGWGYDEKHMQEALDAGANGYVSKGVPIEEVYSALQRVLIRR